MQKTNKRTGSVFDCGYEAKFIKRMGYDPEVSQQRGALFREERLKDFSDKVLKKATNLRSLTLEGYERDYSSVDNLKIVLNALPKNIEHLSFLKFDTLDEKLKIQ